MQTIYLDISNKGVYPCIYAKQGDIGRKFLAVITDNGVPFAIPENANVSAWYESQNSAGSFGSLSVTDNTVEVTIDQQMTVVAESGVVCVSVVYENGDEISTWNIPYDIESKPGINPIIPGQPSASGSQIDDSVVSATKTWSSKKIDKEIKNHHFLFNYGYMKTEYGFRSIYGGITLDNGYISQIVEVEAEDVLSVTCTTPASVGFAAIIFYDGSMNVVSYEKANADNNSYSYTDLIVKVPANAKYAATSSPYQYECKIGKLTMEQTALLLRGKTIVNFGDSIFGNEHDDTSVSSLLAKATFANCVNCGFGGTKMINRMLIAGSTNSGYEEFDFENLVNAIVSGNYQSQKNAISWYSLPNYYQGSLYLLEKIDFSKVDIVTLNFGTNDYTYGEKVATFKTKYAEAVAKLQSAFPNLNVVIISPTWRCWLNADGSFQEDSNTKILWSTGDSTLVDYCNTLQEMAKELNVQYIDVYNIGINKNTWSHYFTAADTTHQNIKGRKRIASVVAKNLC